MAAPSPKTDRLREMRESRHEARQDEKTKAEKVAAAKKLVERKSRKPKAGA